MAAKLQAVVKPGADLRSRLKAMADRTQKDAQTIEVEDVGKIEFRIPTYGSVAPIFDLANDGAAIDSGRFVGWMSLAAMAHDPETGDRLYEGTIEEFEQFCALPSGVAMKLLAAAREFSDTIDLGLVEPKKKTPRRKASRRRSG